MMHKFWYRLRWWLTPGKMCRGCCLWCKYFPWCYGEAEDMQMFFMNRRAALVYFKEEKNNA